MLRIASILIASLLMLSSSKATAAVLSYQEGTAPNSADLQTVIYTNKVGTTPVSGGFIEIKGRTITIYGRSTEVSEQSMLLSGQLIKTKMSADAKHLNAIAFFTDGSLLQKRLSARQNDIVFIEGGFVSGKIDSFTPQTILINDHGYPTSVKLNTVLSIRSPRVYNLQLDLGPAVNSPENPAHQYDIIASSLKETVPPQMISSESINPKKADDDLDFDLRDLGDDE